MRILFVHIYFIIRTIILILDNNFSVCATFLLPVLCLGDYFIVLYNLQIGPLNEAVQ